MERTFLCSNCGGRYRLPLLVHVGDVKICHDCAEEHTTLCTHCGQRIWREENAGNEATTLCITCHERHYTNCVRCGNPVRMRDALYESGDEEERFPYCPECYEQRGDGIHEYSYKPAPVFYGDGPRYFGVELEIDEGGEYDRNARLIMNVGNTDGREHIYCKHDGSLDEGFEIVSHPMTLDYHIRKNPNWTYVDGYIDEGLSGTTTRKRENFNRMVEDGKAGLFDLILTKEIITPSCG